MRPPPHDGRLNDIAGREVDRCIRELPDELRVHASRIVVSLHKKPGRDMIRDGIEPDLLGLFLGKTMADELTADFDMTPQILLFINNIWDYAEHDMVAFREEVRLTFLHELGHFLGLEESDLEIRGLE